MFLTADNLHVLTGRKRYTAQANWLRNNGFNFRIAADGSPRVLISHVEKVMGGHAIKIRSTPNFDAVKD